MMVRPILEKDCTTVVQVHLAAFSGFFLSFLGPRFLNTFYLGIIKDQSGIVFLAEIENEIAGFVVGTTEPGGFYKRLIKRDFVKFAFTSLPSLVKDPRILPRLLRSFTLPGHKLAHYNCSTLMSIAVRPEIQGKGIGKELVVAFINEARKRGSCYVNLTTDAINNDAANHFYSTLGFEINRQYATKEGRLMNELLIGL